MTGVAHPGVVIHAFAPLGGDPADSRAAAAYLESMWDACARLGMDEPLLEGLPTALGSLPEQGTSGFRLLAGRSGITEERAAQAFAFVRHDVFGVCVALSSTSDTDSLKTWTELLTSWREAGGDGPAPPPLLGTDLCFVAHADGPPEDLATRFGPDVQSCLRAIGLGAWDVAFRTADGFTIWEWQDPAARRIVALLSTRDAEDAASRWLWWGGDRELAPFARYLLNAAKLAYEARVYEGTHRGMTDLVRQVDQSLSMVVALQERPIPARRSSMQSLDTAQRKLTEAQAQAARLAIELTRMRALKRTVGIARHNLALASPPPAPDQPTSTLQMFERDQALAGWLENQLDQDVGYGEAVVARAREAQTLTQLRLQQALTQLTRAQSRVTLLQTSLFTALLASFTAISVLKVDVSGVADSIKPPLVAAFVSLLLAMPPLAAHWFERYGIVDHVAAMVFGGAAGWLVGVLLLGSPPVVVTLAAIAVGAAAARLLTSWHDRWMGAEIDREETPVRTAGSGRVE